MERLENFIRENGITEVECVVPDMSGVARGKIIPAQKFLRIWRERGVRLPESVFLQTVTGEWPEDETIMHPTNRDIYMVPDPASARMVPWYDQPTAQILCDAVYEDGSPVEFSSRYILQRILKLYEEMGWRPIVAPELEFYLVQVNKDPDYPLVPPIGRNGRQESARQSYGIDAVNEFDPILDLVYDYCDAQRIDIDTLTHEVGPAQIEINFNHGDPMDLADQAFLFKRTVRQAAIQFDVYATFMAMPMKNEPGSAMHIHQSVMDINTGKNIFSDEKGQNSRLFLSYIAGLQRFMPCVMPLVAPNVNSYRRIAMAYDSPINTQWGLDNRTTGFRVPASSVEDRRVENRIIGADANPYLAIAATLACGYLGMVRKMKPTDHVPGSAYNMPFTLPRHQADALTLFQKSKTIRETFGGKFVDALIFVKQIEFEAYHKVISSWERENLLLSV